VLKFLKKLLAPAHFEDVLEIKDKLYGIEMDFKELQELMDHDPPSALSADKLLVKITDDLLAIRASDTFQELKAQLERSARLFK
jgi:hypothetical protein